MNIINRFLIVFANLKGNVGDFAILHAMILDLRKKAPGCAITVASHGFLPIDKAKLYIFSKNISGVTFWETPPTPFPKWLKRISQSIFRRTIQAALISHYTSKLIKNKELSQATQYDAILLAGGEQWSGKELGLNMFSILGALYFHNKKIFSYPFSLKKGILKFNSPKQLRSYFRQFASPPLLRDSNSYNLFRKIGIEAELGADCVFSLASNALPTSPDLPLPAKSIVLAVTQTTQSQEAELESLISELGREKYQITLLTTCQPEDDTNLKNLSKKHKVHYVAPASWTESVSLFQAHSLVITNRLHCMIFCFFAKVPVLPLVNRDKVRSLAQDSDLPYALESLATTEKSRIVSQALTASPAILEKMVSYLEKSKTLKMAPDFMGS